MSGNELAESLEPDVPQEEVKAAEVAEEVSAQEGTEEPKPGEEKPRKLVPLDALHEERERRKGLQQELGRLQQEQQQRYSALEQRMAQIQQAAYQAWQEKQPKPPAYEDDPVGSIKHGIDQTQAELAQLRDWRQKQDIETQQREYVGRLHEVVGESERAFAKENSDYLEAVGHLKAVRIKQLEALGMNTQEAFNYMQNEAFQIAEAALQRGLNPAERAYEMAKASGWTPKPKVAQPQEKLETLQKGVKAAQSLGSGGTPSGKVTMDQLAEMDDDSFAEFMKSGGWQKMGG